ncbi:hypothetical protein BDN71DRAFT_1454527 [Pleurotus eryngii]|uniref:Uncharacterized protein n=1 Tax=Pleurotus eryngii TaxID=5323 RepID=A0A9P5ZMY0_PLEER|nr:hypothetical protein BDN71DRAFT_1454527 [Pleurotus eryngii]
MPCPLGRAGISAICVNCVQVWPRTPGVYSGIHSNWQLSCPCSKRVQQETTQVDRRFSDCIGVSQGL